MTTVQAMVQTQSRPTKLCWLLLELARRGVILVLRSAILRRTCQWMGYVKVSVKSQWELDAHKFCQLWQMWLRHRCYFPEIYYHHQRQLAAAMAPLLGLLWWALTAVLATVRLPWAQRCRSWQWRQRLW